MDDVSGAEEAYQLYHVGKGNSNERRIQPPKVGKKLNVYVTGSRKRGHFAHKMIFQYKRF